jgi:hypothetical protein
MAPYFQFPPDNTKEAKKLYHDSLDQFKYILKAKKVTAIAVTSQAYKMFRLFVIGNQQTQWDKIIQEMHTKDPWIGMNGISRKRICVNSWPAFLDCIELHKLTIFPVDATEKQCYYMVQTVKKPQQVTVRQYMACMGVNDYLAHLPMVWSSTLPWPLREQRRAMRRSMRLI